MIPMNIIAVYMLNELQYIQNINFEPSKIVPVLKSIVCNTEKVFKDIDWNNLILEQAKDLGFRRWTSKEDIVSDIASLKESLDSNEITKDKYETEVARLKNIIDLYLIPAYLAEFVLKGITLTTIFGIDMVNIHGLDKDSRCRCLSVGLKFNEHD